MVGLALPALISKATIRSRVLSTAKSIGARVTGVPLPGSGGTDPGRSITGAAESQSWGAGFAADGLAAWEIDRRSMARAALAAFADPRSVSLTFMASPLYVRRALSIRC